MVTSAQEVTGQPREVSVVDALRATFPFVPVVLPWLLVRLLVVPVMMAATPSGAIRIQNLITMDGAWFRLIALDGYDTPYTPGGWSEYPFFPLFPGIAGALMQVGTPSTLALAGTSWLAALAASAGAYRLATIHLGERTARWVPWFVALAPGGLTMVMGYADSLYLAALLWAFVLVDRRAWWGVGLVAAVATAARPNGVIAVVALVVAARVAGAAWRSLVAVVAPSAAFLLGWMWFLDRQTGDPLVFWEAKDAWRELTIVELLRDPTAHDLGLFHLACMLALVVPYLWQARRQPLAWAVVVVLTLVPPLLLGVEGLARYAVIAFPVPFGAAATIVGRSHRLAVVYLSVSTVALVALAWLVVYDLWVP